MVNMMMQEGEEKIASAPVSAPLEVSEFELSQVGADMNDVNSELPS